MVEVLLVLATSGAETSDGPGTGRLHWLGWPHQAKCVALVDGKTTYSSPIQNIAPMRISAMPVLIEI